MLIYWLPVRQFMCYWLLLAFYLTDWRLFVRSDFISLHLTRPTWRNGRKTRFKAHILWPYFNRSCLLVKPAIGHKYRMFFTIPHTHKSTIIWIASYVFLTKLCSGTQTWFPSGRLLILCSVGAKTCGTVSQSGSCNVQNVCESQPLIMLQKLEGEWKCLSRSGLTASLAWKSPVAWAVKLAFILYCMLKHEHAKV